MCCCILRSALVFWFALSLRPVLHGQMEPAGHHFRCMKFHATADIVRRSFMRRRMPCAFAIGFIFIYSTSLSISAIAAHDGGQAGRPSTSSRRRIKLWRTSRMPFDTNHFALLHDSLPTSRKASSDRQGALRYFATQSSPRL